MSLSLTITARSSDGERSWRFADSLTASAMLRHWDGVQAGVCQRIRSFTAQIVCARQGSLTSVGAGPDFSLETTAGESATSAGAATAWEVAPRPPPSRAAAASDKESFGLSASTWSPLLFCDRTPSREVGVTGLFARRGPRPLRWQRFDPPRR